MVRLNGWQRLWVILGVLYGALLVWGNSNQWPTQAGEYRGWVSELISEARSSDLDPEFQKGSNAEIRERLYPDLNERDVVNRIREDYLELTVHSKGISRPGHVTAWRRV